ncbi:Uncharacterised protein [Streptococcus pneumoniae]|nr:Uncharacterised protein [Streptococcus pneumoniae]
MFELTYKDCYHVERTLKYEDHEALMLTLSGCVTLTVFYLMQIFYIKTKIFLSFFLFLLIFSQCFYKIEE